jgi:inosine-uridine nucleoside N-ribohydrolase
MSVVVFNSNDKLQEVLIDTPKSNDDLFNIMLNHKVGYSQIRAVKAVNGNELLGKMAFQPRNRHHN